MAAVKRFKVEFNGDLEKVLFVHLSECILVN